MPTEPEQTAEELNAAVAAAVVDELEARRAARAANLRCPCGSEWFRAEGVVLAADGSGVTGITAPLWCVDCGTEVTYP